MATAVRDADALDVIDLTFVSVARLKKNEMWSFDQHAHRRPIPGSVARAGEIAFGASLPTPRNQSGWSDRSPYLIAQSSQAFDVFRANSRVERPIANGCADNFRMGCIFADLNPPARPESYSPVTATHIFCISEPDISPSFG
jgi:hypothetical protein